MDNKIYLGTVSRYTVTLREDIECGLTGSRVSSGGVIDRFRGTSGSSSKRTGINSQIKKMLQVLLISQNVGAAKKEACTVVDLMVLEATGESSYR